MMGAGMKVKAVGFCDGVSISSFAPLMQELSFDDVFEYAVFPGFCDVHVHFREPGFSYKETIESGSKASARGGYTAVCTMPNLNPVPDSVAHLAEQRKLIEEQAVIHVYPYGAITVGEKGEELADLEGMAHDCIAFSDDGRGVQSDDMMRQAMQRAKALGKMIVAHCEVNDLLKGGYIHDGQYAAKHNHKGICSASEYEQIARDLKLVEEIGCAYHVCHISTKEEIEMVRAAKLNNPDIVAETSCNYLWFSNEDYERLGSKVKCNPAVKTPADREALRAALRDGLIDTIGSDHAPHLLSEKDAPYTKAPSGLPSIQQTLPVLLTIARQDNIPLEKIASVFSEKAAEIYGLQRGKIEAGWYADLIVVDIEKTFLVKQEEQLSKCGWTPYEGETLYGVIEEVIINGLRLAK